MDFTLEKKILTYNLKILSWKMVGLALGILGAMGWMMEFGSLSLDTLVMLGEELLSPLGILLFVRIPLMEQFCGVEELVLSKAYPYWKSMGYRILLTTIQLLLLLALVFLPIKLLYVDFSMKILFGSFVTAFYLGVMAMTLGALTREISLGALFPFLYYFFEMFSKGKYTKGYYLFGMLVGDYESKVRLLIISILLVGLLLALIKRKRREFEYFPFFS